MVDGNKFDLCPLFDLQKHDGWLLETEKPAPPSIMTNQYRLKIDGSLAKNETLEDNMQVREISHCGLMHSCLHK